MENKNLNMETQKTFEVILRFENLPAHDPLEAAKTACKWVLDDGAYMIYEVIDEETKEKFTVDLSEQDEDAVLPYD